LRLFEAEAAYAERIFREAIGDMQTSIPGEEGMKNKHYLKIRPMEIDDLAWVFHLGETLFTARSSPNLYRTWDEYEVVGLFQGDSEYCFVAELDELRVGSSLIANPGLTS
jgi:hypothetical protein